VGFVDGADVSHCDGTGQGGVSYLGVPVEALCLEDHAGSLPGCDVGLVRNGSSCRLVRHPAARRISFRWTSS